MSLKSMVTVPAGSPIWALCWPFVQVASLRGQPSVLTFPTSNTLSSGSGAGGLLDLVAVGAPPCPVGCREIVVAFQQSGCAVNKLSDDVGVTGVPLGVGCHVHEDAAQGHRAVICPPRHAEVIVQFCLCVGSGHSQQYA